MWNIKSIFICIFLFFLFYFEPYKIGSFTFSQIWKLGFFLLLLFYIMLSQKKIIPRFIFMSYARASKNLINGGIFTSFFTEAFNFVRYLMFPVMFETFNIHLKNLSRVEKLLTMFSQFVIISGIPFILGLTRSLGENIMINDFESYVGIFQFPHAASSTTAIAVIILLYNIFFRENNLRYKIINFSISIFGIYLIYMTYVRTGYLMFFVGSMIMFFPKKISIKQILTWTFMIFSIIITFIYLIKTNETFHNRIFDIRNGQQSILGSGRLIFWIESLHLWQESDLVSKFFGVGMESLYDWLEKSYGLRVYAHNEFFTQLSVNGILGILLLLGFLYTLWIFIRDRRACPSYHLSVSIFFLYLSLMFTQGGNWFQVDIFMALLFVQLELENIEYQNHLSTYNDV